LLAGAVGAALLSGAVPRSGRASDSAPASAIDLGALTRETQQQYQDPSTLQIVWWLPVDIWAAVIQGDPAGTTRGKALDLFDAHLVFFVAEADISPLGNIAFRDPAKTRERFRLQAPDGRRYPPLPEEKIPADMRVLLNTMLPALASGAGEVGKNFRPFVFEASDASGARIAAPREPGELVVLLNERRFRWRLPLGSLLAPKYCPVDDEELSGAFRYCPYHGAELRSTAADPESPKTSDTEAVRSR